MDHADALVAAAPDGVEFDGLRVEAGDGYAFRTPGTERTGLSAGELREGAAGSPYVTNWYFWHELAPQVEHRWAFLRWLEGADERDVEERYDALAGGVAREWGQIHVRVALGEAGRRRYRLRHVDDAGRDAEGLDRYDDPLEARHLAKHDDEGRYRPLKTAPTLATGWEFPALDAAELVAAVDYFYPATVANWHREREGELDLTHWTETAGRQTGIYGVVETWDRQEGHDHVDRLAATCCADSECLKRREWEYDADTDLAVEGGDGVFPCREPCSMVVSAARKFVRLDGEQTREYTVELTESEADQLGALVDAVADDRDVREADFDDPANRWRARYLRETRFDTDPFQERTR
ncbi:MAG: DR2241 family protein [Halobacteriaceae archaeon]